MDIFQELKKVRTKKLAGVEGFRAMSDLHSLIRENAKNKNVLNRIGTQLLELVKTKTQTNNSQSSTEEGKGLVLDLIPLLLSLNNLNNRENSTITSEIKMENEIKKENGVLGNSFLDTLIQNFQDVNLFSQFMIILSDLDLKPRQHQLTINKVLELYQSIPNGDLPGLLKICFTLAESSGRVEWIHLARLLLRQVQEEDLPTVVYVLELTFQQNLSLLALIVISFEQMFPILNRNLIKTVAKLSNNTTQIHNFLNFDPKMYNLEITNTVLKSLIWDFHPRDLCIFSSLSIIGELKNKCFETLTDLILRYKALALASPKLPKNDQLNQKYGDQNKKKKNKNKNKKKKKKKKKKNKKKKKSKKNKENEKEKEKEKEKEGNVNEKNDKITGNIQGTLKTLYTLQRINQNNSNHRIKKIENDLFSIFLDFIKCSGVKGRTELLIELAAFFCQLADNNIIKKERRLIRELGKFLFCELFSAHESTRSEICSLAFNYIVRHTDEQIKISYTEIIENITSRDLTAFKSSSSIGKVQEWLNSISLLSKEISYRLITAFLPISKWNRDFVNFLFILFRKMLNNRETKNKSISIFGFTRMFGSGLLHENEQQEILRCLIPAFNYSLEIKKILFEGLIGSLTGEFLVTNLNSNDQNNIILNNSNNNNNTNNDNNNNNNNNDDNDNNNNNQNNCYFISINPLKYIRKIITHRIERYIVVTPSKKKILLPERFFRMEEEKLHIRENPVQLFKLFLKFLEIYENQPKLQSQRSTRILSNLMKTLFARFGVSGGILSIDTTRMSAGISFSMRSQENKEKMFDVPPKGTIPIKNQLELFLPIYQILIEYFFNNHNGLFIKNFLKDSPHSYDELLIRFLHVEADLNFLYLFNKKSNAKFEKVIENHCSEEIYFSFSTLSYLIQRFIKQVILKIQNKNKQKNNSNHNFQKTSDILQTISFEMLYRILLSSNNLIVKHLNKHKSTLSMNSYYLDSNFTLSQMIGLFLHLFELIRPKIDESHLTYSTFGSFLSIPPLFRKKMRNSKLLNHEDLYSKIRSLILVILSHLLSYQNAIYIFSNVTFEKWFESSITNSQNWEYLSKILLRKENNEDINNMIHQFNYQIKHNSDYQKEIIRKKRSKSEDNDLMKEEDLNPFSQTIILQRNNTEQDLQQQQKQRQKKQRPLTKSKISEILDDGKTDPKKLFIWLNLTNYICREFHRDLSIGMLNYQLLSYFDLINILINNKIISNNEIVLIITKIVELFKVIIIDFELQLKTFGMMITFILEKLHYKNALEFARDGLNSEITYFQQGEFKKISIDLGTARKTFLIKILSFYETLVKKINPLSINFKEENQGTEMTHTGKNNYSHNEETRFSLLGFVTTSLFCLFGKSTEFVQKDPIIKVYKISELLLKTFTRWYTAIKRPKAAGKKKRLKSISKFLKDKRNCVTVNYSIILLFHLRKWVNQHPKELISKNATIANYSRTFINSLTELLIMYLESKKIKKIKNNQDQIIFGKKFVLSNFKLKEHIKEMVKTINHYYIIEIEARAQELDNQKKGKKAKNLKQQGAFRARKRKLHSRNTFINEGLQEEDGTDAYTDLESFVVDDMDNKTLQEELLDLNEKGLLDDDFVPMDTEEDSDYDEETDSD
ncbi:hypothetical protein M0813_24787 [Anaeramoeba flamelloides]|uniref:FANCI solenoid 2 domain-containing protein n=1 Tax=Anaeramoeba flamelloides TaxID=1746091 RepID=A0ABQ8Y6R9_9EUKA|nr:hypothetical protein M0813_24787 [Anaeramoeba flamelloides]